MKFKIKYIFLNTTTASPQSQIDINVLWFLPGIPIKLRSNKVESNSLNYSEATSIYYSIGSFRMFFILFFLKHHFFVLFWENDDQENKDNSLRLLLCFYWTNQIINKILTSFHPPIPQTLSLYNFQLYNVIQKFHIKNKKNKNEKKNSITCKWGDVKRRGKREQTTQNFIIMLC